MGSAAHRLSALPGTLLVAMLVFSCATGTEIGLLDPQPVVPSPGSRPSTRLTIGDAIADSFEVPARGRAPTVRVRNWRRTLVAGFENALAVRGAGQGGEPSLTVQLKRADLVLVASRLLDENAQMRAGLLAWAGDDEELPILLAHGGHSVPKATAPPTLEVYAEITYVAAFVGEDGVVVGRSHGSVLSKMATSHTVPVSQVVQSAVERMIERIAADLADGSPGAPSV